MQFTDPWAFILCIAAVLVPLGAAAGEINTRTWLSEPLICMGIGILDGPVGLGLLHLDVGGNFQASEVMREAARVTLAIAVTGAALRLPTGWLWRNWRGLVLVLGPGMLLMWGVGSLCAGLTLGLTPLHSLLVGAVVTPTDPVLAAPVVSGRLARQSIPEALRQAITAESGANDGLALPLVMLPVLVARSGGLGDSLAQWAVTVVLWQVGAAIAVGALAGWLASRCLLAFARRYDDGAQPASMLSVALALAIAALAAARVLEADGILAAFVAGLMVDLGLHGQTAERQHWFNEAIGRFFDLPVMVLFGAALPWHAWMRLGWGALAFVTALLLFRRMPAWLALHRRMPWTRRRCEALFAGWFGPMGVSAVFYATDLYGRTDLATLWPLVSLAAASSVLVHGLTSTPFTKRLGRALGDEAGRLAGEQEEAPTR